MRSCQKQGTGAQWGLEPDSLTFRGGTDYTFRSGKSHGNIHNISSPYEKEEDDARVSRTHEHPGRQKRHQAQTEKGTEETRPLKRRKAFASLLRKSDFRKVFDQGRRIPSRHVILYALPNGLSQSRVGLAVGKKIGGAVVRNRVKRRLRELLREFLNDSPMRYDLVIVARSQAVDAGFSDLRKVIFSSLRGLTNEKHSDSAAQDI